MFLYTSRGTHYLPFTFSLLGMGLKKIVFVRAQAWQYLAVPAVLLTALWIVTLGICPQIRRLDMAEHINE